MATDYQEIVDTRTEAAEHGDALAQFELGLLYGLGLGVQQDYSRALEWYKVSAQQNCPPAQCNLGYMYDTGRGIPQDYVSAYAWYSIAAAGGEATARRNRDSLALKMTGAQIEKAQDLSQELFAGIARY